MNKKDLDDLNELYLSVYGEEQLNEAPGGKARFWDSNLGRFVANTGRTAGDVRDILYGDPSGSASRDARQRLTQRVTGQPVKEYPDQRAARISRAQDAAIAAADKIEKAKPTDKPTRAPVPGTQPAGSPPSRPPAGSSSAPPQRPATASGPVLSKKDGVEGTGVGANFKARAFTAAEKSRYASVAAKSSASSGAATPAASAPKPATPAVGKLGNTSFERRTPTSAELRAAQAERATQKASRQDTSSVKNAEKALQAAQKTNLPTTGPSPAAPDRKSVNADLTRANTPAVINKPAPVGSALAKQQALKPKPMNQTNSYEWGLSRNTIKDLANAYNEIYEAKKVDQDEDGDNDFADVRIARLIASGVSKEEAIRRVKDKSYNEEVEIDEATRMRKELGKEGETATRQELARRSNAYQRSGSVDKTIAAAERGAERTTARNRDESEGDYKTRMQKRSQTLNKLAANRRGSVRDKPRAGLRGYAAKVEGSDRDLQSARGSARSAGTLTPREKKQLNMEAYEAYEFVASYLLENNFAETLNDANVIIENMSDNWFESIIEEKKPLPVPEVGRYKPKDED